MEENFNEEILEGMSDILFNVFNKTATKEEILYYWKVLPIGFKCDFIKYGIHDTPTKENIYTWINHKNCEIK